MAAGLRIVRFTTTIPTHVSRRVALCLALALPGSSLAPDLAQGAPVPPPRLRMPVSTALSPDEAKQADALLQRLQTAQAAAGDDPSVGRAELQSALDAVTEAPSIVARSPELHEARMQALLSMAELALDQGDAQAATAALDEVIRTARGDTVDTAALSTALATLYQERLGAESVRPTGSLHVTCEVACRVMLNERLVGRGNEVLLTGIPLGRHRLYVEPLDDGPAPLSRSIALLADASEQTLTYAPEPVPSEPTAVVGPTQPTDAAPRRLPRWAGIVGIVGGVAVLAAGGVLLGLDGRCPDGGDPRRQMCPDVLRTQGAGIGLSIAGTGAIVGFSVALGIGESRQRRQRD